MKGRMKRVRTWDSVCECVSACLRTRATVHVCQGRAWKASKTTTIRACLMERIPMVRGRGGVQAWLQPLRYGFDSNRKVKRLGVEW